MNSIVGDSDSTNIDDLIAQVRKPEHQQVGRWSMMRVLYPFHDRLTRVLIRSSIASWQLTVLWFFLSIVSYGVSAIGRPETFLAGAVLLFVAIVIDMSDGEIGRVRAREMSAEEDLHSFIKGMFLDRMCHTICSPLWPIAVAWGLFQLHEHAVVMIAGLTLAAYHTACRGLSHLEAYLVLFFRDRVRQFNGKTDTTTSKPNHTPGLPARLGAKFELWVRNGKRFNFMILAASTVDVIIALWIGTQHCWVLWSGFVAYGAVAALLLMAMLVARVRGPILVDRTVRTIEGID